MTFSTRQKFIHISRRCVASLSDAMVAATWVLVSVGSVHAEVPERLRLMTAVKKFDGAELVTAAYRIDAPQWLLSNGGLNAHNPGIDLIGLTIARNAAD